MKVKVKQKRSREGIDVEAEPNEEIGTLLSYHTPEALQAPKHRTQRTFSGYAALSHGFVALCPAVHRTREHPISTISTRRLRWACMLCI